MAEVRTSQEERCSRTRLGGVPVAVVKRRLGHGTAQETLNLLAHVAPFRRPDTEAVDSELFHHNAGEATITRDALEVPRPDRDLQAGSNDKTAAQQGQGW